MKPITQNSMLALAALALAGPALADKKPNIVVYFADDISARELPMYESSQWSDLRGHNTTDPKFRAKTPVMDRLAQEGVAVSNCWGATVSSPSRAQMMTGRYAHLHKWWHNGDCGTVLKNGKEVTWPIYESSRHKGTPLLISHVAKKAGYGTLWAGKTQMPNVYDIEKYGFDEGVYTPGELTDKTNPYSDFYMRNVKGKGLVNKDNGEVLKTYMQHSWLWQPHVKLINAPTSKKKVEWWPNTKESKKNYGLSTYGPDVELDYVFDFMDRMQKQGKPFMVYHTTHLGHDAYDFVDPDSPSKWPGTPKIKWTGKKYKRTAPHITGDNGVYDTHGTVTEPGMHHMVEYIDYQIWQYIEKFKKMGVDDNTILIIAADNATSGYGKGSIDCQKGVHVPMIIYAPGFDFKKKGMQDILTNVADVLPTIAEVTGVTLPKEYEVNGVSLWPYLTTDKKDHRDYIYSYRSLHTIIRGHKVLKDGRNKWYDVSKTPADLISYPQIKDWSKVSKAHRAEKAKLNKILPKYDKYKTERNGPTGTFMPSSTSKRVIQKEFRAHNKMLERKYGKTKAKNKKKK